jgi:serine/threonine protein kinase/WD40 repeat protein
MRATAATCPQCDTPLPGGPLAGLCPACLLDSSLHDEPPVTQSANSLPPTNLPQRLGRYRLTAEIARGGAAIVFRGRDEALHRDVAIKLLHAGPLASREAVRRLFLEARATARLHHPNILPVYEVGGAESQPFIAMPLLEGGTLATRIRDGQFTSSSPMEIAQLLRKVALAVHHAHRHGILHRDPKPGNILFDSTGEPLVGDFGLVRVLEEDSTITLSQTVLGTPAYMSPEQARGDGAELTVAADIYSLGAILYELLAGSPPFTGASVAEVLRKVQEEEPAAPLSRKSEIRNPKFETQRSISDGQSPVGRGSSRTGMLDAQSPMPKARLGISDFGFRISDLQTICLKCLEKEPAKRYATAQDLADDLERFLNDEPILARPVTRMERLGRWCRRKPAIAGLTAALVLALLAGLAGTLWQLNEAWRNAAENRRQLARLSVLNGINLMQEGDHFRSLLWFADALNMNAEPAAHTAVHQQRIASILALNPKLAAVITHDGEPVADAAFHPAKDQLATVGRDRRLRIWEIPGGTEIFKTEPFAERPSSVQYSPDGNRILVASSEFNHVRLVTLAPTGGEGVRRPGEGAGSRSSGRESAPLAESEIGNPKSEIEQSPIPHHAGGANNQPLDPRFDSTGERLLTQSAPKTLQVWNVADASPLGPAITLEAPIVWMNFSDDGEQILAITQDAKSTAWDWRTGKELEERATGARTALSARTATQPLADMAVRAPQSRLTSAATIQSPDRTKFATLTADHRARVWSADTGEPLTPPIDHNPATGPVQFSASGRHFFTIHPSYAVFVWELPPPGEPPVLLRPDAPRKLAETGRDGSVFAVRDPNSPIRVRGTTGDGEVSLHPSSLKEPPVQAWFDETGQYIILERERQRAQIWDAATGLPVTPVFPSHYATNETDYRTVKLPALSFAITVGTRSTASPSLQPEVRDAGGTRPYPEQKEVHAGGRDEGAFSNSALRTPNSALRVHAELLSGSRLDGTGGWKQLELGEIVARWKELKPPSIANERNK